MSTTNPPASSPALPVSSSKIEAHAHSTLTEQVCRSIRQSLGWRASGDVTEDCLQVARLSIWQARLHLNTLPEDARRAYATVCARRAVVRYLRREQRQQERFTTLEFLLRETAQPQGAPEEELSVKEWPSAFRYPELGQHVQSLSGKDQKILHLYYVLRLTDAEVAQRLDCSVSAVGKQRRRLLHYLRRRLEQSSSALVSVASPQPSLPQEI